MGLRIFQVCQEFLLLKYLTCLHFSIDFHLWWHRIDDGRRVLFGISSWCGAFLVAVKATLFAVRGIAVRRGWNIKIHIHFLLRTWSCIRSLSENIVRRIFGLHIYEMKTLILYLVKLDKVNQKTAEDLMFPLSTYIHIFNILF